MEDTVDRDTYTLLQDLYDALSDGLQVARNSHRRADECLRRLELAISHETCERLARLEQALKSSVEEEAAEIVADVVVRMLSDEETCVTEVKP
jgi:hypothetical protein